MTQSRRNQSGGIGSSIVRSITAAGVGATLALILTGCAGTVSTGYVGEPYYGDPYVNQPQPYYDPAVYGPYYGEVYIKNDPHYHHRYVGEYSHRGVEVHPRYETHHATGPHPAPNVGVFHGTTHGTGHGDDHDRH